MNELLYGQHDVIPEIPPLSTKTYPHHIERLARAPDRGLAECGIIKSNAHSDCGESIMSQRARPLVAERQREIVRLLQEIGTLRIGELTDRFDVSDETIRRDLAVLEEQGLLTRAYGGAFAEGVHDETSYQRRMRQNHGEKERLGRVAAAMVRDGSTIIIDSEVRLKFGSFAPVRPKITSLPDAGAATEV